MALVLSFSIGRFSAAFRLGVTMPPEEHKPTQTPKIPLERIGVPDSFPAGDSGPGANQPLTPGGRPSQPKPTNTVPPGSKPSDKDK